VLARNEFRKLELVLAFDLTSDETTHSDERIA